MKVFFRAFRVFRGSNKLFFIAVVGLKSTTRAAVFGMMVDSFG
jgi:hypothetical protein